MNFIKRVFNKEIDDSVHNQLVRFGKGDYRGRAPISILKTKKIKLKGGFEFANDFVLLASELGVKFSGFIWSKEEINGLSGGKKAGKYVYEVEDLDSSKIKELAPKVYYFLLNAEGEEIKLKIKKKLPKPGKNENKIDDKFCQIELDKKYFARVKDDFFWDLGDCRKAKAVHEYIIKDLVTTDIGNSKDFAKMRELAKRKGKLIRTIECDGKEIKNEIDFEA
ncbi:hypothetical protein CMI39_01735 [Candidatus Pacearchaeota archaeon]|jgi:hypothetical protein|nr:hypothetical protein [Candidatus Pacearchaeota archaeon]|tara:strand:+ start:974 stop:1639 length:666 start_codon:yes stop_codon:yes gene_type:complete